MEDQLLDDVVAAEEFRLAFLVLVLGGESLSREATGGFPIGCGLGDSMAANGDDLARAQREGLHLVGFPESLPGERLGEAQPAVRERVLLVVDGLILLSIVLEFLDIAGEVILLLLQVLLLALVSLALLTVVLVADGCDLLGLLVCIGAVLRLLRSLDDLVGPREGHHGLSLLSVKLRELYLVASRESSGSPGNGIGGGPTDWFVRVIVTGDPDLALVRDKGTLALSALDVDYVVSILLELRGLEQVWQRDLLGLREIVTAVEAELAPLVVAPAPDLALANQAVADTANLKP